MDLSHMYFYSETPEEAIAHYSGMLSKNLAVLMVNSTLNNLVTEASWESLKTGDGVTPIPFMGWYWRHVDFFTPGGVTIAEGDGIVAVCQNNKWGYPQRDLTPEEQHTLLTIVWDAYKTTQRASTSEEVQKTLKSAGSFIAGLQV